MHLPIMGYVAAVSSLVPSIVGIARYAQLDRAMRLFTAMSIIVVVNLLLEFILAWFKITNYFLSDAFFLVEVPVIALVYHLAIPARAVRNATKICIIVFPLLWLVDKLWLAAPQGMNSNLAMATSIILVLISSVTLNALLKSASRNLTAEPVFWIQTGTILYSAGSFIVMGLSNDLLKLGLAYFEAAWYVNWILFTVSMLMYAKGLLCRSQV